MHAHGVDIGAVEQGLVGGRIVALDPLDQLVLAQVFRRRRRRFDGLWTRGERLGRDGSDDLRNRLG
jgi:hypothetical protein